MAATIRLGNAFSRVEADTTVLRFLDDKLAVEVEGAFFARKARPGWDGYWHPISPVNGVFPTGLVSRIKQLIPLAHVVDERVRPPSIPFNPNILHGVTLADHQCESVQAILKNVNGVIATSVSSGKTEVGIAIATHVPGLCVWVTPRRDIFHQTAERIKWRTGEKAAMIGDGCWEEIGKKKFAVVMPQTAIKAIDSFSDEIEKATVLITDEAHTTSSANTWYLFSQTIPAYFRCGLTGTPITGDPVRDLRLEAATGPILIRMTAKQTADLGWAVPAEVNYHKISNEALHGADYALARRLLIEENPVRNAKICQLAIDSAHEGKKCLVICDTIRHVKIIGEVLRGEDVRARVLTGKYSSTARMEAKKDLQTGVTNIIVLSPLWDMGVDIPEVDVVILAAGGKSAVRVVQRIGRSLRKHSGKTKAIVHDFLDLGNSYLLRHSMARIRACKAEGFELKGAVPGSRPKVDP